MKVLATIYGVNINPGDVIEQLKQDFLGNHNRWIERSNEKWVIMQDAYHNTTEVVKEITEDDMKYYEALIVIENHLKK